VVYINSYLDINTLIVSVYIAADEPNQQHTAVRYSSWLWCTAMNLRLLQTATSSVLQQSDVLSEVSAVCVLYLLE
jgi:hypothetical protein